MWQLKPEGFKPVEGEKAFHILLGNGTVGNCKDSDYAVFILDETKEQHYALKSNLVHPKINKKG